MKRRLTILALTTLAVVALIGVVLTVTSPAHAGGAKQISGVAEFADVGIAPCNDPEGADADLALNMAGADGTGDLNGCLYSFIDLANTQCINTGNGSSIYHAYHYP